MGDASFMVSVEGRQQMASQRSCDTVVFGADRGERERWVSLPRDRWASLRT